VKRIYAQLIFLISSLSFSIPANSDVVLLIHGYLSNSAVWYQSGIITTLETDGWKQAGTYSTHPDGQIFSNSNKLSSNETQRIIVIDLPSEAPVLLQSDLIASVVDNISTQYPDEKLTLVGHSAGGLAARAALVRHKLKSVKRLISIASPHLGTDIAEKALNVSNIAGPATMLPGIFGGDIARTAQRSQHLYSDLSRPRLGNLLDWLNKQPHPDINWDSIIHTGANNIGHDSFVAAYSQDMNQIFALRGRSSVLPIQVEHELNPTDGIVLKKLLANTNQT